MPNYKVSFPNQKIEIEAPQGITLAEAAALAGLPLNLVCGGKGLCGKCLIEISDGIGSEPEGSLSSGEPGHGGNAKSAGAREPNARRRKVLACRTLLERPAEIFLRQEDSRPRASILTEGSSTLSCRLAPAVTKAFIPAEELRPADGGALTEFTDPWLLQKVSVLFEDKDFSGLTMVYLNGRPIDVQAGDTAGLLYGAACDIGTTSVALYIYDLISGQRLKTCSALNRQISHGADVLSRISFCGQRADGAAELRELIFATINELLAEASLALPALRSQLYALTLCGNTAMQHFFFGLSTKALGRSPFLSLSLRGQDCLAGELKTAGRSQVSGQRKWQGNSDGSDCGQNQAGGPGRSIGSDRFAGPVGLAVPDRCALSFLPLLGGFVGADITAVLLTLPGDGKLRLAVDLGTNGEIALGRNGHYLVASTACGPALEGAALDCGTRGQTGAVERVTLLNNGDLDYAVIGGGEARGLCGSGIVDLTAALLAAGVLDETGRLFRREEYEKTRPGSPLAARLGQRGNAAAFFLTEKVWLSQKDIRQIQLAKAAIRAGCLALAAAYGATLEEIDELALAGAFGNRVDVGAALDIGLLPGIPPAKILAIGNGAGLGASMALLDRQAAARAEDLAKKARHLELSGDSVFMEEYLRQMNFPGPRKN